MAMGEGSGPSGDAMVPQKIDGNPLKKKGTTMAKYNAFELKTMEAKGQTMAGGSYPIADGEDLDNAIHAVGRGNADHNAIRAHIIKRAAALGMSAKIPDNWNSDGSMKPDGRSAPLMVSYRSDEPHDPLYADLNPATWKTVTNGEELAAAITALGDNVSDAYSARRRYLMAQATSLGLSDQIPNNWGTDGTITETAPRSDVGLEKAGFIRNRFFVADMEIRSDGRTLCGVAVPFGQVATVNDGRGDYDECFVKGAFARTISGNAGQRVKLMANHDHKRFPIGRSTLLREDNAGLVGEFHVSQTRDGDEVLQLAKDGVLDSFSVGFTGIKQQRNAQGVVERHEVGLREVSVVAFGAYSGAVINGVRNLFDLLKEDPDSLTPAEWDKLEKYLNTYRSDGTPFNTSEPADIGTSEVTAEPPPVAPAGPTHQERMQFVLSLLRSDI